MGKSLRTAQRHSRDQHPEWVAWYEAEAKAAVLGHPVAAQKNSKTQSARPGQSDGPPDDLPPQPPAFHRPAHLRTVAEHVECLLYHAVLTTSRQGLDQDVMISNGSHRTLSSLLPRFLAAKRAREQDEERNRKVVPIDEFYEITAMVQRVATVYDGILELAARLNPSDPALARQVLSDWQQRQVQPKIEEIAATCQQKALVSQAASTAPTQPAALAA